MIRERWVQVGESRVRCLEAGAGRALVWLHAFPLHAEMWRPQLERIADGWRFLAPDFRGFGPAGAAAFVGRSMEVYARDILDLLDVLAIDRAVIGGLSMGGYVAFAIVRLALQRVDGLILADTRPQADTPDGRTARERMRSLALERGAWAIADEMLPRLLGTTSYHERPEVVRLVRRLIESNTPVAIAGALEAMMWRPDSSADLRRLAVPALVLVGEEDAITPPADAEILAGLMREATLRTIPAAGHLSSLENPEAFSEAVSTFLQSLESGGRAAARLG
jgi:pimeloyl-ACP methyl ester carboxylesterase